MKKTIAFIISLAMLVPLTACSNNSGNTSPESSEPATETASETSTDDIGEEYEYKYQKYASMSPEEIVAGMTLEQKTAQMVQPAVYNVSEDDMKKNDYSSILFNYGLYRRC